jgi:hypothetical protein
MSFYTIYIGGEVVCAGAMDPFLVYVWSLQTGKLLDTLAGHEGKRVCVFVFVCVCVCVCVCVFVCVCVCMCVCV